MPGHACCCGRNGRGWRQPFSPPARQEDRIGRRSMTTPATATPESFSPAKGRTTRRPTRLTQEDTTVTNHSETAILAGGCFWGMQDLIRKMPGVLSTRVGYTGGENANATYRNHPGHAEAIEIIFDPEQLSYRDVLEFFFQIHDPTTKDRQGNDI